MRIFLITGILVLTGCSALVKTNKDVAEYASLYYPSQKTVVIVNGRAYTSWIEKPKPAWKVLTPEEVDELTHLLDERDADDKNWAERFTEEMNELNALLAEFSRWDDYQKDLESFKLGTLQDAHKVSQLKRLIELNDELTRRINRNKRIQELFWSTHHQDLSIQRIILK